MTPLSAKGTVSIKFKGHAIAETVVPHLHVLDIHVGDFVPQWASGSGIKPPRDTCKAVVVLQQPQRNPPTAYLGSMYHQHFRELSRVNLPHQSCPATPGVWLCSMNNIQSYDVLLSCANCIMEIFLLHKFSS